MAVNDLKLVFVVLQVLAASVSNILAPHCSPPSRKQLLAPSPRTHLFYLCYFRFHFYCNRPIRETATMAIFTTGAQQCRNTVTRRRHRSSSSSIHLLVHAMPTPHLVRVSLTMHRNHITYVYSLHELIAVRTVNAIHRHYRCHRVGHPPVFNCRKRTIQSPPARRGHNSSTTTRPTLYITDIRYAFKS